MNDLIAQQLINKAKELNESPFVHLNKVNEITTNLRKYISGEVNLNQADIKSSIIELTMYTSLVPVSIPLSSGAILSRAVKYDEEKRDQFEQVSRHSYIPTNSQVVPKIGRLNTTGESLFYACLNADSNSNLSGHP